MQYKNIFIIVLPRIIMIPWLILLVLAVIMLAYLKLEHEGRNIKMIVTVVVIILIYLSVVSFLSSNKVNVDSPKGIISGFAVYGGWFVDSAGKIFNLGKEVIDEVGNIATSNYTGPKVDDGRR